METNHECEVCGGKEFAVDAGYYYCEECGTRAKEIQEVQYELSQPVSSLRVRGKKIKKSSSSKSKEYKLTSWEIYNYALIGLVDELQKLGASELFKITTLQLWTAYLTSIDVAFTSKQRNLVPKLPVLFKKDDAEILYGRRRRKRRRKTSNSSSVGLDHTSLDASFASKQRRLENKALIEAEYQAMAGTQQSDTNSVFNSGFHTTKSTTSLTPSAVSSTAIRYNSSARKEFLKNMDCKHFHKHTKDQYYDLKCHKPTISEKYRKSATFVTRNCLWAILYLALNISEDKLQLGDMIRFCREGHISYFNLKHFIPEEYLSESLKNNEILQNAKYKFPCHNQVRTVAYKIAKMIGINYLCKPDVYTLCERFCMELELPPIIAEYAQQLSFSNVNDLKSKLPERSPVPNYEGQAMAYIILILKLIFGLDDYSEYIVSERVNILNAEFEKIDDNHMPIFSWKNWSEFIVYRNLIISQKHFPTSSKLGLNTNSQMFVNFWNKLKCAEEFDDSESAQLITVMKKIFTDLKRLQNDSADNTIVFEPSLTPFRDHFNLIIGICQDINIPKNIICNHSESDFSFFVNGSKNNIHFLDKNVLLKFKNKSLNSNVYIWEANKEIDDRKTNRHEIVNVKSTGVMEWDNIEKNNTKKEDCIKQIDDSKRRTLIMKNQIDAIKSEIAECKQEVELVKSAKFGGTVKIDDFQNLIIEKTLYPDKSLDERAKQFKSIYPKPILPRKGCVQEASQVRRKKWFVSSYVKNPLLDDQTLRLGQKILPDLIASSTKDNCADSVINIPRPVSHYWINHFNKSLQVTNILFESMENKFPSSFSLLLQECARVIEVSKFDLYKELIEIEQQFGLVQFCDRNRRTL